MTAKKNSYGIRNPEIAIEYSTLTIHRSEGCATKRWLILLARTRIEQPTISRVTTSRASQTHCSFPLSSTKDHNSSRVNCETVLGFGLYFYLPWHSIILIIDIGRVNLGSEIFRTRAIPASGIFSNSNRAIKIFVSSEIFLHWGFSTI